MPPAPSKARLQATGAADDIAKIEAKALAALTPAMAQAQKELSADLAKWMQKLGPNAHLLKFTPAHLKQVQILLGIAEAKVQTTAAGYPHASFPMVASKAVQNVMGQAMPHKQAAQTLEQQLLAMRAKFKDLPSPQLIEAATLAKGDKLILNNFKKSATRYAGQVGQDLRLQFGVGMVKGETIQQLTKRIAGLSSFQKAVDASHPTAAGNAMAGALTKRYHNWAQRLVRTELAGVYNQTAMAGIQAAHKLDDRIMAMWDATNDMRVCVDCKLLHGTQIAPTGGGFFKGGFMHPPAHPNCRCAVVTTMADWDDDEEIPYVPSVEEVEAKEKLTQKVADEAERRAAASKDAKEVAKQDLQAYDQHQAALAAKKAAEAKAAAAAKAAKEEAEYQAMLAAQKKAAEKAAAKAAADALKAKKAALAALKPAAFDPLTTPTDLKTYYKGKKAGQETLLNKGGFALVDKNTIVGHGHTYKWDGEDGEWVGHKPTGFEKKYDSAAGKYKWSPVAPPAPAVTPQPVVVAAKPNPGPQPMAITGHVWKDVGGQWVLHNSAGVPTSQLVPKYSLKSPMLLDTYSLGGDIAKYGLVPVAPGVMEGHGYKFVKNPSSGIWEKTMSINQPYSIPTKKASPSSFGQLPPRPAPAPPPPAWKPQPITLAAKRKGVIDFNKHPSNTYEGFHGRAFTQDGDVIEGGSVRVVKVKGKDGKDYYEANFKVTHPYGSAAQAYGSGTRGHWAFNGRTLKNGVLTDNGQDTTQSNPARIHTAKDHTVEIGTDGAMKNAIRIRAKSLAELNGAFDEFSKNIGADLRKPPEKVDLELQAKARLAAKFDPETFGQRMRTAASPEQQKAVINEIFEAQAKKHPVLAKAMADAKEVEVYPGHKTLYSASLGKHLKETYGAMYHDGSASAEIAAAIAGKTGLMSSVKRYNSGVFTTGMSTGTDFSTGGADGVFMRVSKTAPSSTGGDFRVVLDTEKVMGRLDWWAFNHDNYGRADYGNYSERWSVPAMKNGYAGGTNEVMVTNGVPTSAMKKIICRSEHYRQQVLTKLRAEGITEIDGRKIEDFVTAK